MPKNFEADERDLTFYRRLMAADALFFLNLLWWVYGAGLAILVLIGLLDHWAPAGTFGFMLGFGAILAVATCWCDLYLRRTRP